MGGVGAEEIHPMVPLAHPFTVSFWCHCLQNEMQHPYMIEWSLFALRCNLLESGWRRASLGIARLQLASGSISLPLSA